MMKKVLLVTILNVMALAAIAQSADLLIPKNTKTANVKVINGTAMLSSMSIIQNVSNAKEYSILFNVIKSAGFKETLESKGPITFFAPTNSAFAKLPAGKLDSLLTPEHKIELSSIVAYHAIAGKVSVRDISKNIRDHKGTAQYITLAGTKLWATVDANRNIILTDETGGRCTISQFDIEQSNGMLHVVNGVFIPKYKAI